MPELPEVETVRSDLVRYVKGKTIKDIKIKADFAKKISPRPEKFIKLAKGQTIKNVNRRGKLLIIDLGANKNVLAHMKMTGQFVFWDPKGKIIPGGHPIEQSCDKPDRFNKVIFDFGTSGKLYYNDPRKFGYLKFVDDQAAQIEIDKFGIEPLESKFSFKAFNEILNKKKNLDIKKVLLMQDMIAGIGNIYADESCFAAGILCTRKAKSLKLEERKKLYREIRRIMKKAIKYRGTSVATYIDCLGQKGSYAQFLNVYHRVGQLCKSCKQSKIERKKVGGRGTSFCPVCQK
jgi:formamidopyrimidine-DNA glycosylase